MVLDRNFSTHWKYSLIRAEFESTLFLEVCKILHVNMSRTTPLHPQSDRVIERMNYQLTLIPETINETVMSDWTYSLPDLKLGCSSEEALALDNYASKSALKNKRHRIDTISKE